jgi:hypothetical protein
MFGLSPATKIYIGVGRCNATTKACYFPGPSGLAPEWRQTISGLLTQ